MGGISSCNGNCNEIGSCGGIGSRCRISSRSGSCGGMGSRCGIGGMDSCSGNCNRMEDNQIKTYKVAKKLMVYLAPLTRDQ